MALHGVKFTMADGTEVLTDIANDEDSIHLLLFLMVQNMRDDDKGNHDMIVGLDTEWAPGLNTNGKVESYVALLKLCSNMGCVLIRLDNRSPRVFPSLLRFFSIKDVIFAGVRIKEDLEKLRKDYGIEVRNAVELTDLAASVIGNPRLCAYGVRDLAAEVVSLRLEPRSLPVIWVHNWFDKDLTHEQMECATIDTYATYKIAKQLLQRRAS